MARDKNKNEKKCKGVDPNWPEASTGDHPVSEFNADRQGALSPFGEGELPLPGDQVVLCPPGDGDQPLTSAGVRIAGLLLAAGAGRRFGGPKALLDTGSGPWVLGALEVLAGCTETVVVVGAAADQVTAVLPAGTRTAHNPDYPSGMGSSLALGLAALLDRPVDAALVMLVDLPNVTRLVADRLIDYARAHAAGSTALARAAYAGRPGHPVLIGRDHFQGVLAGSAGDAGARNYLLTHSPVLLECCDVGGGRDVDNPDQL